MSVFLERMINTFYEIARSLSADPSVWWLLAPIILVWIITELYYGEYKKEHIGFSSALSVGISFLWLNLISLRIFFLLGRTPEESPEIWAVAIFGVYAVFIIYVAYTHAFPHYVLDKMASPTLLYFLSIISILWSEGLLIFNRFVAAVLLITLIFLYFVFFIIKKYFLGLRGDIERVKELSGNHGN